MRFQFPAFALSLLLFVLPSSYVSLVQSFVNNNINVPSTSSRYYHRLTARTTDTTILRANIFDDVRNFFDDMMSNSSSGGDKADRRSDENPDDNNDDETSGTYTRVATIPVSSIKPGGLRLFLMFYLMGMQNTPNPNSWRANQPVSRTRTDYDDEDDDAAAEEYVLDYRFHDGTAMITISLCENAINIDRLGSFPSTAYTMQETIIVQGVLDELHQCAFDESIDEVNRLLLLPEPHDAIEKARDALAFG